MPNLPPRLRVDLPHVTHRLEVQGRPRDYLAHAPAGSDGQEPLAVVLMFHGGGATAKVAVVSTGWSRKADEVGCLVVYPQAVRRDPARPPDFARNPQFWNTGSGMGHAERHGVDDVLYVDAVLADAAKRYSIDRSRVFACGFSNGAAMALRYAAERSENVAALGAIAGHLWLKNHPPRRAVPLLYMCGAADPVVPLQGGTGISPWGREHVLPSVADTVRTWAAWCGCASEPETIRNAEGIKVVRFPPLRESQGLVEQWTIAGMGHVWPGGQPVLAERLTGPHVDKPNATDEMWSFFERVVAA